MNNNRLNYTSGYAIRNINSVMSKGWGGSLVNEIRTECSRLSVDEADVLMHYVISKMMNSGVCFDESFRKAKSMSIEEARCFIA